ncbi:hypothetical protein [Bartonella sp. DGB2]|uniref:hypothetical protein n=1 Tax=Bartonella sp. DGB2 TaxID=3388426 RepID=UPI00398FD0DE
MGSKNAQYEVQLLDHGIPLSNQAITFTVEGATLSGGYSDKDESLLKTSTASNGKAWAYLTPTRTGDIKLYAEFMDETSGEHLTAEYKIIVGYSLEFEGTDSTIGKYERSKTFTVTLLDGGEPAAEGQQVRFSLEQKEHKEG